MLGIVHQLLERSLLRAMTYFIAYIHYIVFSFFLGGGGKKKTIIQEGLISYVRMPHLQEPSRDLIHMKKKEGLLSCENKKNLSTPHTLR